jgi:hypothetical protein
MAFDNVDRRLLARFEASAAQERARRDLLPPEWLNAEPEIQPGERLGELFDDVLARARERVQAEREALALRRSGDDLDFAG